MQAPLPGEAIFRIPILKIQAYNWFIVVLLVYCIIIIIIISIIIIIIITIIIMIIIISIIIIVIISIIIITVIGRVIEQQTNTPLIRLLKPLAIYQGNPGCKCGFTGYFGVMCGVFPGY